ncbi:hypothetical protein BRD09_02155 [Halobacteriales archaeon SW_10_68_16]|nr:MAG: hypothetical protein BRD09_02155 [Halobacteriales archaeon SW_10_68_16]
MRVALVCVGDELLAGDTVNTNATWLGSQLRDRGVDVERVTVVPDRIADIARVVNEYRADYDAVVVTGGLGPTHDDLTMEGVAGSKRRVATLATTSPRALPTSPRPRRCFPIPRVSRRGASSRTSTSCPGCRRK